jgi:UDP-N-acetyl-2-amino-2-deoxyglucuronate dehydrogenase
MSAQESVRFGVIGLGIGQSHIRAIQEEPDAELAAVASTDEAALRRTAEQNGVPGYLDYYDLLARDDVDVVCVCVPSGLHAEVGIAAAKAGKHVLCEKPLDISLERADALIAACQEAGVQLGAVFQNRFHPVSQAIKQAIDSGRLGRIVYADTHLYWYRAESYFTGGDPAGWHGTWKMDGGGAFINQGVHSVDLIQWLAGPVASVYTKAGTFTHNIQTEDVGTALLTFQSGALGNITCTTSAYPGLTSDFHFVGEKGSIVVRDLSVVTWRIKQDSREAEEAEERAIIERYSTTGPNPSFDPRVVGGHRAHISDMVGAVREGRPPKLDGVGARPGLALALAILESARTGREVEVKG